MNTRRTRHDINERYPISVFNLTCPNCGAENTHECPDDGVWTNCSLSKECWRCGKWFSVFFANRAKIGVYEPI